jgi:hypothetical protein
MANSAGRLREPWHSSLPWLRPTSVDCSDDARLVFGFDESDRFAEPSRDLLDRFIRLRDPEAVVEFAGTWGPLLLCKHGKPPSHNALQPGTFFHPTANAQEFGRLVEAAGGCWPLASLGSEPVEMWLDLAERFRATLNLASRLYRNRVGDRADWRLAMPDLNLQAVEGLTVEPGTRIGSDRVLFAFVLQDWLDLGHGFALRLNWNPLRSGEPQLDLIPAQLYDTLVFRLVCVATRTDGIARCSACSEFFCQPRRPPRGRRVYCEDCRAKKKPQRDAERDRVARRRSWTKELEP